MQFHVGSNQGIFKRESDLPFAPCVTLGRCHIISHVWRQFIVPLDEIIWQGSLHDKHYVQVI